MGDFVPGANLQASSNQTKLVRKSDVIHKSDN
jgi:hypothetical protein